MKKFAKSFLSIVLVLAMLVVPMIPVSAATVPTQSQAVAWANSCIGKAMHGDSVYGAQCVDLIYCYYEYLLGSNSYYGNACDYITCSLPSEWTRISYTDGMIPRAGDIAVWKTNHSCSTCNTGWAGHVGIVIAANANTFDAVNQNYNSQAYCSKNQFKTNSLACVIRPNFGATISYVSSWNDYKNDIYETNAVVGKTCVFNGTNSNSATKAGIYLYDANDKLIKEYTETASIANSSYISLFYDINLRLGITLNPGTTYKYKLMMVVNGVTHTSPVYSFTTKGTAPVTTYTVTFKDWDGSVISTKTYEKGATVEVPANPTREEDEKYTYVFSCWDNPVTSVTGNITYTAVYTKLEKPPVSVDSIKLVVESKEVVRGNRLEVKVNVKNNNGFAYLLLSPIIPDGFTLVEVKNGSMISDFSADKNYVWVNDIDVKGDGTLMTFVFDVPDTLTAGEYKVGFSVRQCCTADETEVDCAVTYGTIKVLDIVYGDATGDGIVDGKDLVRLKKYIAAYDFDTGESSVEIDPGADATGDGIVDGKDLVRLKKYIAAYDFDTGTSSVVLGPQ